MKTHTDTYKENIKLFGRELDSKITYTLDNEEIELGVEELYSISPHYEGGILKSVMKQLDVESSEEIPIGTIINYQFGLKTRSGKNLYNLNTNTTTVNGITFTKNDDGTYNISGTATAQANIYGYINIGDLGITNGEECTISSNQQLSNRVYPLLEAYNGSTWLNQVMGSGLGSLPKTANAILPSNTTRVRIGIRVTNGTTVNLNNVGIQLEKGSQATSYEKFGQYEYLDFGNYIVKEVEKQEDTRSWKMTCYDKMLLTMKDYSETGITYPITIRDYINSLCIFLGLTFKNASDTFANYDKEIQNELYLDENGASLGYTFRDVFDELASVTASTICINENDELEIRYIKDYKLPSEYSELDYIESSTLQYIDTGVLPTEDTKIDLDFSYISSSYSGWAPLFGERDTGGQKNFGLFINSSSLKVSPNYGGFDPGNNSQTFLTAGIKYNLKNVGGQFYLDNVLKSDISTNNSLETSSKSIWLFNLRQNNDTAMNRPIDARIYRCKFYEDDELIRDFIPALRTSDNEVGLYDIVNNVFYENEGSNSFAYGDVVLESIDEIDEEYLKDINVNFGEKYGPVNSIVLSRAGESDNVYLRDEDSVEANGLCEIKIVENQIMNFNDRSDYLEDILAKLNGLQYYINDFSSTGITYYDLCDRYNIKVDNMYYSCVMFNDDLHVTQGLVEDIHTDMPEGSETDYTKADKTDRRINQTYIIANKQTGEIQALTSRTSNLEDETNNMYTIEQVNDLIQNAEAGVTNTFSEAGGNNIFRNTGLWFSTNDNNNPYEFWSGNVVKQKEEKASNLNCLLLQNNDLSQEQTVPNGTYTISFKYKKLIELAEVSMKINDTEYELSETDETEFIQVIQVNSQHINLTFTSDIVNACEIYDLMVNAGGVKLAYSQNQNETTTDTVNISKGITITSTDTDTTFKANADGIRTLDNGGNVLTEFTDTGMIAKKVVVQEESQIVNVLWQEVGSQTWLTRL